MKVWNIIKAIVSEGVADAHEVDWVRSEAKEAVNKVFCIIVQDNK